MTSQTSELCRNLFEALNPVRDITKNWGIDLAQHLEHYLEQIAVDHAEMPMNFAEAALLIQNSTTIYSKKVDYIWDIMQCVLANIHKKKHDGKSSENHTESENCESTEYPTSKSKRSRNHNSLDRTKYGEINTEISDKILDLEASKEKRKPWKFIPTIYHQFQKKSISRKAKYTHAEPDDPHEDRKFKVNQWLLHYKMLHHEFKDEEGIPDLANCFQNSISMVDHNATFHGDQIDDHMDDSVSHGGGDEPLENAEPRLEPEFPIIEDLAKTCNAEAAVRREKDNLLSVAAPPAEPVPPVNAWDPIPFDQGMVDKEIGHRKTTKLPCDIELLEPPPENGKRKKGKEITPKAKQKLLSKYLQLKSLLRKDMKKQFVLDQDFLLQRDIMAQLNRPPKKPIKFAEIRHELAEDFDEFADFFGFEDYENSVGEKGTGFLGFGDYRDVHNSPDYSNDNDDTFPDVVEPLNINVPLPTNDHLALELPPDSEMLRSPSSPAPNSGQAFEAMCLERIQPQKTSEEIIRGQVDLAKRVAHWHDTIKPMLAASEKRAHFDIHEYGTQILNSFPKSNGAKTTLPLKDILQGVDTQDVSRYFLAMLQLANTYNVEITTPKEPLVVDEVEVTLLTASRLHEDLDNYVAPSQERTSISGSSRSPGSTSFEFAQPTLPRPKTTFSTNQNQRKRKL